MKSKSYSPACVRSASYNETDNTIEVVWSTGADVLREDYDGQYVERLSMAADAVRLNRLNSGAPLLDSHQSEGLCNVIGVVVEGSARIEDGKGIAIVLLSKAKGVADTVQKIREGVIKNISVGYWTYTSTRSEGNPPVETATDWEPLELSAVPIPADAGAQFRSARTRRLRRRSRAQSAADYARGILRPAQSSEQVRGAAEAQKAIGRHTNNAMKHGAREARRLLRGHQ